MVNVFINIRCKTFLGNLKQTKSLVLLFTKVSAGWTVLIPSQDGGSNSKNEFKTLTLEWKKNKKSSLIISFEKFGSRQLQSRIVLFYVLFDLSAVLSLLDLITISLFKRWESRLWQDLFRSQKKEQSRGSANCFGKSF